MKYLLVLFFLASFAVGSQESQTVNEVVFSIAGKASTQRDLSVYQFVIREYFQKNKMSVFVKKDMDDFLLSRLAYQEALAFDFNGIDLPKKRDVKKNKNFSESELQSEQEVLAKALAYMEIKEAQVKEQGRFETWFELLKRKYQVKYKAK